MIVYDLQGAQSVDHRDRGVARAVKETAAAIEATDGARIGTYSINPRLTLPNGIEPLIATRKVRPTDVVDYGNATAVHLASAIELSLGLDELWPPGARTGVPLVVTLYDLVSEVLADQYLADPGLRRRYRTRIQLLRQADRVIAISQSAADDAVERLGLDRGRITVVPLAVDDRFHPPTDRKAALPTARRAVPDLADRFVLYTGGTDPRKNVERLLAAWGRIQDRDVQLVLACKVKPLERNHYEHLARTHGFERNLLVTGFVGDDTLVALNQSATLAVFPSLYEGFGLPVAEALACGTPAIASNTSSLPELLPPEQLFDPTDPAAMAVAIDRALAEPAAPDTTTTRRWPEVAADTTAAYDLVARPKQRAVTKTTARRPRVALVSPFPPLPTGVAQWSTGLLAALRGRDDVTVDAFVDGPPHLRAEILSAGHPTAACLPRTEALLGPYDCVVYAIGNSEYHTGALALLRRRPGVVIAHDVRLTNLYRFAPWQHADASPGTFADAVTRIYGEPAPVDEGLLMAREVISLSTMFLATSPFGAELAALDAAPADRAKVASIPFAIGPSRVTRRRPATNVVATFGVVHPSKRIDAILDALPSGVRLAVAGYASDEQVAWIESHGKPVDTRADYDETLATATVAVQLRDGTNGESSAATGDCLAAGIPTIVSAVGAARDLPDDAVVKIERTTDLADALTALLADEKRRAALSRRALAHAERHTFAVAADALVQSLGLEPEPGPG